MSLGKRLLNVARAELSDTARKLRDSAERLVQPDPSPLADEDDADLDQIRAEIRAEEEARWARGEAASPEVSEQGPPPHVQEWYANLELPIGAPADEVKAAYRRLMRRYHPDRHALDPARAQVAHEIAQQLRAAYDGLNDYLQKA